jgi:hypothetical protein
MKCVLNVAIVFLALPSLYAQDEASASKEAPNFTHPVATAISAFADPEENSVTTAQIVFSYAANIDGLLRDVADRMRNISEQVEAGELTPLEAQALKLETAQAMIARLETFSAVYDSMLLFDNEKVGGVLSSYGDITRLTPGVVLERNWPTVNVRDLITESSR